MEARRAFDRSVSRRTGVIAGFRGVARTSGLLTVIDLTGTVVFAIEGAMMAVRYDLDLLGIVVLAFATALGGGIMRDVILGATPRRRCVAGIIRRLRLPAAWSSSPPATWSSTSRA